MNAIRLTSSRASLESRASYVKIAVDRRVPEWAMQTDELLAYSKRTFIQACDKDYVSQKMSLNSIHLMSGPEGNS